MCIYICIYIYVHTQEHGILRMPEDSSGVYNTEPIPRIRARKADPRQAKNSLGSRAPSRTAILTWEMGRTNKRLYI